jgi:hypothetical protein
MFRLCTTKGFVNECIYERNLGILPIGSRLISLQDRILTILPLPLILDPQDLLVLLDHLDLLDLLLLPHPLLHLHLNLLLLLRNLSPLLLLNQNQRDSQIIILFKG